LLTIAYLNFQHADSNDGDKEKRVDRRKPISGVNEFPGCERVVKLSDTEAMWVNKARNMASCDQISSLVGQARKK
jgi:hypothetical protein